jgi:hypothetical protein
VVAAKVCLLLRQPGGFKCLRAIQGTAKTLSQVAALRGDELQAPLQRLVEPGPLALEEPRWVHPFGTCLRDETVRNHGTGSGLASEARAHLSGTAGVRIRGRRPCRATQPEHQRQRRKYSKQ